MLLFLKKHFIYILCFSFFVLFWNVALEFVYCDVNKRKGRTNYIRHKCVWTTAEHTWTQQLILTRYTCLHILYKACLKDAILPGSGRICCGRVQPLKQETNIRSYMGSLFKWRVVKTTQFIHKYFGFELWLNVLFSLSFYKMLDFGYFTSTNCCLSFQIRHNV